MGKKVKRDKGFTLIELLAVITIMGILMLIAIPAVSRTIENSRKSTYKEVALKYIQAVRQAVAQDEIECGDDNSSINSVPSDHFYYLRFDSSTESGKDLMESGGKSPYGNGGVKGVVVINKEGTKYKYAIAIVDEEGRGIGSFAKKTNSNYVVKSVITEDKIEDQNITKSSAKTNYYNTFDADRDFASAFKINGEGSNITEEKTTKCTLG